MVDGYCTYEDVKKFFVGVSIERLFSQSDIEDLIDRFGLEVERISHGSWRAKTATDELYSIVVNVRGGPWWNTYAIHLENPFVREVTALKIFDGNDWIDKVSDWTEGRGDDYYVDGDNGIIYINGFRWVWHGHDAKVSYTYGETSVSTAVWELNLRYVARHIMSMPSYFTTFAESNTGKKKDAIDRNEERVRELEERLAMRFGVMSMGDWT